MLPAVETKVRVRKMSSTGTPLFRTPSMEEYVPGQNNEGMSIPTDYWMEGKLLKPIQCDEGLTILRTNRMGVEVLGYFTSSKIISITENDSGRFTVETMNSVYQIEVMNDQDQDHAG